MKTITIRIDDETAEALDKMILSRYYYNYPEEQAYSLVIDELVLEVQKLLPCHCCCYVPPHCHPPSWWV